MYNIKIKNILGALFMSFFMLFMSYDTHINKKLNVYYGYYIDLGFFLIPIISLLFLASMFFLYQAYNEFFNSTSKSKPKPTIEHTICPTCKQTFNYKDLKDGKCPTCKDADTIEIEQYYKDNPFKEDDEN